MDLRDASTPVADDGLGNSAYPLGFGDEVSVLDGGARDWARVTGHSLEQGA